MSYVKIMMFYLAINHAVFIKAYVILIGTVRALWNTLHQASRLPGKHELPTRALKTSLEKRLKEELLIIAVLRLFEIAADDAGSKERPGIFSRMSRHIYAIAEYVSGKFSHDYELKSLSCVLSHRSF